MGTFIRNFVKRLERIQKRYIVFSVIILTGIIGVLVWFNWPYQEYKDLGMRPQWTVADNIVQAPKSQIFAQAVYDFEYTKFLAGEGPYTVFVPTDESYNRLSPEMKYFLNDTANQGSIRQVVLYHVVPGLYRFSDLKDGTILTTVEGEELVVTHSGGQVLLNGLSFIRTYDALSKNGVIHTVDGYLIPPSMYGSEQ